jgi:XRE family transcriptional regulator, regulator of sulfur utilization
MNNNMIIKQFGWNVRELRLKRKWTQEQLAQHAGLTPNYIGFVERGERNITLKNAVKIAKGLNFPVHKLFEGI